MSTSTDNEGENDMAYNVGDSIEEVMQSLAGYTVGGDPATGAGKPLEGDGKAAAPGDVPQPPDHVSFVRAH